MSQLAFCSHLSRYSFFFEEISSLSFHFLRVFLSFIIINFVPVDSCLICFNLSVFYSLILLNLSFPLFFIWRFISFFSPVFKISNHLYLSFLFLFRLSLSFLFSNFLFLSLILISLSSTSFLPNTS